MPTFKIYHSMIWSQLIFVILSNAKSRTNFGKNPAPGLLEVKGKDQGNYGKAAQDGEKREIGRNRIYYAAA